MTRRIAILLTVALAAPVLAGPLVRSGDARVTFNGKGPAGFKLVGTTSELKLEDDGKTVTATVPLDALKTGIDLRDRHMREKYLETAKHPNAVLVLDRQSLTLPTADGQTVRAKAKGKLTLHGVTREQELSYTVQRQGGVDQVTADLKLNFKDFGVSVPSYLGVTVKPEIEVQVSLGVRS